VLATVWAKRMEQRLSAVFAAGADRLSGRTVWRIRYRTDIDETMLVSTTDPAGNAQRWEIEAVQEYGRRVGLDLICTRTGESA